MSVYQKPGSSIWYAQFEIRGRRVHKSTEKTTRREAEAVEQQLRAALKEQIAAEGAKQEAQRIAGVSLRLEDCITRYMRDIGDDHAGGNAKTTQTELDRIQAQLGADTLITEIGDEEVARLRAWRRGCRVERGGKIGELVSDRTVNATMLRLKALMGYVKRKKVNGQKVALPNEPEQWADYFFKLVEEHPRELQDGEWACLIAAARECYQPILELAYLTGFRLSENLLQWPMVNWGGQQIARRGKGGKLITRPMTGDIRELLFPLQGHHPEAVFTYVAERTATVRRRAPDGGLEFQKLVKGQRYPVTREGLKTEWRRLRAEAGIADFRFHDIRHDFASKTLRREGDLKLLRDLMGHASFATTSKYAHVLDRQKMAAMEGRRTDVNAKKSPTAPPRRRKAQ